MTIRLNRNVKKKKVPIQAIGEKEHALFGGPLFSKISISLPIDMRPLIRERAEQLHLTVSQYVRRLVNDEINVENL
jgi:hypothetical protein